MTCCLSEDRTGGAPNLTMSSQNEKKWFYSEREKILYGHEQELSHKHTIRSTLSVISATPSLVNGC